MNIVITADSEIDYHVTIIDYNGSVKYFYVGYKFIDKFLEDLKKELGINES